MWARCEAGVHVLEIAGDGGGGMEEDLLELEDGYVGCGSAGLSRGDAAAEGGGWVVGVGVSASEVDK
jgi:hypothetical protein